ncbi:AbgT family transporter [Ornithinibacillus sp. 4-3]|uniref:AbgT family transporter n=1 Tax=Ornithinibacillus sp. 4-3 TaxID=3231488 RepID=A0AB39HVR5_9BACI
MAGTDVLLAGISTEAVRILDDSMVVSPLSNWYFNIVSVFVLTVVGGLITSKFIEPRLGKYEGDKVEEDDVEDHPKAGKALRNAVLAGGGYMLLIFVVLMLPNSPLRSETGGIADSPFIDGIVPLILILFILVGLAYGITVEKIKSGKDVSKYMGEAIKDMSGYIVLVFAIAQFIAYFNWSNIGTWLAVNGAEFLTSINFTGLPLILGYILFTACLNFLITSGSAKWAIEAPVFIPMFMQLGYHPGFIQVAYRIADSSTNIVTPLYPLMIIILTLMQKYDKKANIGTYMALMIPYSLGFLLTWIVLILIFYFTGLPFGPGVYTHL